MQGQGLLLDEQIPLDPGRGVQVRLQQPVDGSGVWRGDLTDQQNRLYIDSQRKDTLYQTRVGRTFAVGVNARF